MIKAIVAANSSDPKTFLPALAATKHDGVTGHIQFDGNGDVINPAATLFRVRRQEWIPFRISCKSNPCGIVNPTER